jgi:hypothetical protein
VLERACDEHYAAGGVHGTVLASRWQRAQRWAAAQRCFSGGSRRGVLLSLAEEIDGAIVVLLRGMQRYRTLLEYEVVVLPQTLAKTCQVTKRRPRATCAGMALSPYTR